ncbi:retrotransposon protein, putative, ty1-copia subclass [Tanacetum coccineum]
MISSQNHQVDTYDECEQALDIEYFDLRLTLDIRPNNNPHIVHEITTTTQTPFSSQNNQVDNCIMKPIRIITGLAGIVLTTKLCNIADTREGGEELVMSIQEYIRKVIEDVGIVTRCFGDVKKFLKNRKHEKVVAVIKSCTSNALGDLIVTLKDLFGTIFGTIHYKVLTEERFEKEITCTVVVDGGMERGLLSQKGSGGRGVIEKSSNVSNIEVVMDGVVPSFTIDSGNAAKEVVSPVVVDETMAKEKQSSLVDTIGLGSYSPLPTQGTTTAGNTLGKSSYANVTGKPSGTKVNFRTLFTPGANGIDVVVLVEYIRAMSEQFANTAYGFFLGKRAAYLVVANNFSSMDGLDTMLENGQWFFHNNPLILKKWHPDMNLLKEDVGTVPVWVKLHRVPVMVFCEDGLSVIATKLGTPLMLDSYTSDMCMQSLGMSSYTRAMIELQADVELKDNIVVAMPKITGEGYYTCNIRVEYKWKPPRCACCKVFGHVQEECPKNIDDGAMKNVKKTSQTPKGILVRQKMGFKSTKQVFQPVPKKYTANTSRKKKNNVERTKEVSKSSPFEVLTSVENDVEMGTNGGTSNLASRETNSSRSSFLNVDSGKTFIKGVYSGDYDSEDEVASVDNEMTSFLAKRDGYGTQSLLEQWKESYENDEYEYDPYDDDMYEGQEIPEKLQAFCDNLDITVRGRRKK